VIMPGEVKDTKSVPVGGTKVDLPPVGEGYPGSKPSGTKPTGKPNSR